METQETEVPVRAAELYRLTWERYSRLLTEAPTLTLKSFCKSSSVNYRGMQKWTRRQGLSVKTRKRAREKGKAEETIPLEKVHPFVQLVPPQAAVPQGNCLHQVNITFPDGVSLTLQECTFEGIVTLIDTYNRRRSAREAACSL